MNNDIEHELWRVWLWTSNNRNEVARIKAPLDHPLNEWLKNHYIKPEYHDEITENDFGIEWTECTRKECMEIYKQNYDPEIDGDYDPDSVCDMCSEPDIRGYSLEQIENPEESDYSLELITGTNEYFDLTKPEGEQKSEDWDSTVSRAWQKDPQLGLSALLLSSATPREALSDELFERSKRDLQEAGLME